VNDRPNLYYNEAGVEARVKRGNHRAVVGDKWEEVGQLQFDFLVSRGLKPEHRLLDLGCGSLRAGVRLVRYLDPKNYYGTDISPSLLKAGYDTELANEGLTDKLPRSHLVLTDGGFDFSWCPVTFEFALAQSLFTHLPLSFLRACLERLHTFVVPGASLYATFFEVPQDHPVGQSFSHSGGITSHEEKDPYHYRFADVERSCDGLPWRAIYIGEWNHPRSQHMIQFIRTGVPTA
jgi:SAM-dependent methyltransferase